MNKLPVTQVDTHMAGPGEIGFEKHQVAGLFLSARNLVADIVLHIRGTGQLDAVGGIDVLSEGRAVDGSASRSTHKVGSAQVAMSGGGQGLHSLTSARSQ